ncbi:MAG: phosphoglycerate dehydrogenase [Dehalococcoidia bacterium]|jgi:D-3-phosphoglycerate dehydrogenase|nr:MAG: D-3-phosphoglycerate dehydrogenase [Chloroflexota bacterium]|tara:strand:- start:471 stop:2069 length:1599 start_codon:yes stop_codon:yes gene_type:complete
MIKILVADKLSLAGIDLLKDQYEVDIKTGLNELDICSIINGYEALLVRSQTQVTAKIIDAANNLKVIARAGVGIDNIDLAAATERGIIVVNAPSANTISAAEHAFGLMLAVARNIPQGNESLHNGKWDRSNLMGVELYGKTLGLLGLGRIGAEVAKRALAFEMNVLAHDPFVSDERAKTLGVTLVDVEELFSKSDFISLHTALVEKTKGMINKELLSKAKDNLILINAARGPLINSFDLLQALENNQIKGAAIDVFDVEPAIDDPLTKSNRIVVTPHLGASTREAQDRAAIVVAEEVMTILNGGSARYATNLPMMSQDDITSTGLYTSAAMLAASVANQISTGSVKEVKIDYFGQISHKDCSMLRASVLAGLFYQVHDVPVTIVNAEKVAEQHGLKITEISDIDDGGSYVSSIGVTVINEQDVSNKVITTFSGNDSRIINVNDFKLDFSALQSNNMLVIGNNDAPGAIGEVGSLLAKLGLNINSMFVSPGKDNDALMVVGLDSGLSNRDILAMLELKKYIYSVEQADIMIFK